MIRGIHHIGMHTKNFDAMRAFYREAFGFVEVGEEMGWQHNPRADAMMGVTNGSGRLIVLKGTNCCIELFEYYTPEPRAGGPAIPSDVGYTHFSVEVTEIEAEIERLKGLGMTFNLAKPTNLGWVKSVYGRDPDGNTIELQETVEGPTTFDAFSITASDKAAG